MKGDKWSETRRQRQPRAAEKGDHEGRQMKGDKAAATSRRFGDFGDQQPSCWEVRTPIVSSYLGKNVVLALVVLAPRGIFPGYQADNHKDHNTRFLGKKKKEGKFKGVYWLFWCVLGCFGEFFRCFLGFCWCFCSVSLRNFWGFTMFFPEDFYHALLSYAIACCLDCSIITW